jgi:hypothetical protein
MYFFVGLRNYKTKFTLRFKHAKIDVEIKTFEKC